MTPPSTNPPEASVLDEVRCPGIRLDASRLVAAVEDVRKRRAVLEYREDRRFLWVVFVGGTGTGKSTIFNTLCGRPLSATGIERPKTCGPIAYAHQRERIETGFPFTDFTLTTQPAAGSDERPHAGRAGQMELLVHGEDEWSHLILVDTPDLDSLESRHRRMAEDLVLLSDLVVFVTSQEKYADGIPYAFLRELREEDKPCLFVLNKASQDLSGDDVLTVFRQHGVPLGHDRFWVLPYVDDHPPGMLPPSDPFRAFSRAFADLLAAKEAPRLAREGTRRAARSLERRLTALLEGLAQEQQASGKWRDDLEKLLDRSCERFLAVQHEAFSSQSRGYLQAEIRRLFGRYDVLARPRRFVAQIVKTPIRALGLMRRDGGPAQEERTLARLRRKIDLSPVRAALDQFNRRVLEELSPPDPAAPLHRALRAPGIVLAEEEVEARIWEEQDRMVEWLHGTFDEMARGIPKSKEWGIYSTSIFWGIFILSVEAGLGGGIGVLDAAVDSLLAPFVTKGAMELFAYRELQKIARELAERYRESLLSVIRQQRDRYAGCLDGLVTAEGTRRELENLRRAVSRTAGKQG